MPIRPRPYTFRCSQCGWKKTVAPLSDALGPHDWCERCERCGSEALTRQPANLIDRTVAQWYARFRK